MNAMAQARKIISELEQILSDQIAGECPACGAISVHWEIPVSHKNGCALVEARDFLGKEA